MTAKLRISIIIIIIIIVGMS